MTLADVMKLGVCHIAYFSGKACKLGAVKEKHDYYLLYEWR